MFLWQDLQRVCVVHTGALMDAGVDSRGGHFDAGLTGHRKQSRDSKPLRVSHYVFSTVRQMESCSKGNVLKHLKCLINKSKRTQREDRVRCVFVQAFLCFSHSGLCFHRNWLPLITLSRSTMNFSFFIPLLLSHCLCLMSVFKNRVFY